MNYKIFQPYYKKGQLETLDAEFTPYDNMENERPELREYHIFNSAIKNRVTEGLDAWGFFSTRWKAKTRLMPKHYISWVDSKPGYDVYLVNPAIIQECASVNVWEQGDVYHPKMMKATQTVLDAMGLDIRLDRIVMTSDTYCFCSYFVASRSFWEHYTSFLQEFFSCIDSVDDTTKSIINRNANYKKDASLNYFPFIVERLFPTFLHMHQSRYRIASFPYQYDLYRPLIGDIVDLVKSVSLLKKKSVDLDNGKLLNTWQTARIEYLGRYIDTFRYEEEHHYDPDYLTNSKIYDRLSSSLT